MWSDHHVVSVWGLVLLINPHSCFFLFSWITLNESIQLNQLYCELSASIRLMIPQVHFSCTRLASLALSLCRRYTVLNWDGPVNQFYWFHLKELTSLLAHRVLSDTMWHTSHTQFNKMVCNLSKIDNTSAAVHLLRFKEKWTLTNQFTRLLSLHQDQTSKHTLVLFILLYSTRPSCSKHCVYVAVCVYRVMV